MKNQILESTKNIIKYIDINISSILFVFKKLARYINKNKETKIAELILEKITNMLLSTGSYAVNEKVKNIDELFTEQVIIYKTLRFVLKNINTTEKEKKIIKIISLYLLCTIRLIIKLENIKSIEILNSDNYDPKNSSDFDTINSSSLFDGEKPRCSESSEINIDYCDNCNNCNNCSNSETDTYNSENDEDKRNLISIVQKLKCIFEMLNLLKAIISMLEKQFVEQINNANSNILNRQMDKPDIDIINKLVDIYSSQFSSIASRHCGKIFEETVEPKSKSIIIKLSSGKEITLCIIDNIFVYQNELNNIKSVNISIGTLKAIIRYISANQTYSEAISIFADNIDMIDGIKKVINNNQKLLVECLATIEQFLKYKLLS